MVSYWDSPSCLEDSMLRKCILKQQKNSEEFILKVMDGKNDSLELFLPGCTLGTFT